MKRILGFLFAGLLSVLASKAQTTVIAQPVADARGYAAFEIVKVVRVEGRWRTPPVPGMLIYPKAANGKDFERAYPLGRFGEAVVIAFAENGNFDHWWGYHVFNGFIPGLNGESLVNLIQEVEHKNAPAAPVEQVKARPVAPQVPSSAVADNARIQELQSLHLHF